MSNELKHHGVLGMKWGVRRMTGPDGRVLSRREADKRVSAVKDAYTKAINAEEGSREYRESFDYLVSALGGKRKIKDLTETELEQGELIAMRLLDVDNIDLERYSISTGNSKKTAVRWLDRANPLQAEAVKNFE